MVRGWRILTKNQNGPERANTPIAAGMPQTNAAKTNLILYILPFFYHRSLLQDPGNLPGSVPTSLHGHFLELRLSLQFAHEDFLHQLLGPHHLRHEIQEALLPGK